VTEQVRNESVLLSTDKQKQLVAELKKSADLG
jgi:hypothetical protein